MKHKDQIAKLTDYLREKYKPKAIILHGSRASGAAGESSDYDFALVMNSPFKVRPEEYQGLLLDVSAVSSVEKFLKTGETPIWPCELLFDDEDMLGKILILRTEKSWLEGPPALTPEEIDNRKNYTKRLLQRLKDRGNKQLLKYYYLSDIYDRSIRYWFEFRNIWTMPIYKALPCIKEGDLSFYKLLEKLWTDDYLLSAKQIYLTLFREEE